MAIQEVSAAEYSNAMKSIASDTALTLEDREQMQQNLIRTMQYIVDTELQKVQYDTSVEAIVINTDQADRGIYGVRIGETKCEAYSSNGQTYNSNDVVYVTIPKGDYANDKFIIGRKSELVNDVGIYDYTFPFDDFIQLKELIRNDGGTGGIGYRANQKRSELLQNDHVWELGAYTGDIEKPIIGTKLGITVDIQALLIDYEVLSGNYGLLIHVEGYEKDDSGENNTRFEKNFKLDINEMYGNPYVFPEFTTQQVVVDISNAFSISAVQVSFWQDYENEPFLNEYNQYIPWRIEAAGDIPCEYNLRFKNLAVYLGYATGEIENNTVFLYTYHDLVYGQHADSAIERSIYDAKTMHMAFVHKDAETGTFHLYDDDQELHDLGAHVYWYIKTADWEVSAANPVYGDDANIQPYDRYLGNTLWAPIGDPPNPITAYNEERWEESSLSFQAELTKDRYAFKVVVELDGEWYISDVLIFSNEQTPEADAQSIALNNKVILRVAMLLSAEDGTRQILYPDETLQHFLVYDENNRVLTSDDKREIEYIYNGETLNLHALDNTKYSDIEYFVEIWMRDDNKVVKSATRDLNSYIRLADWCEDGTDSYVPFKVTWTLPPSAESMMEVYHIPANYDNLYTWFAGRNAMTVNWGGDNPDDIHTRFDVDRLTTVAFKIKDFYNFQYPNNTISVKIERNGQSYSVKREFYFGKAMAQGSPYTPMININLPEGNSYWVANQPFELECKVIDLWGKEFSDYTCNWTFVGETQPTNIEYADSYSDAMNTTVRGHNAIVRGKAPSTCVPLVALVYVNFNRDIEDLEAHDSESESDSYSYTNMINESLHTVRGIRMTNNEYFLTCHTIVCPEKIQFSADGQTPQYFTGDFICKYDGVICESEDEAALGLKDEHPAFFYPTWHLDIQDTFLQNIVYLKNSPKYQSEIHTVLSNDEYNENYNYVYLSYETLNYVVYDKNQDDANHTQWKQLASEGKMAYRKAIPFEPTTAEGTSSEVISPPDVNQYRLLWQPSGVDSLNITRNTWQWQDGYLTDPMYLTSLWFEEKWKRKWVEQNSNTGQLEYKEQTYTVKFLQTIAYDRSLYPSSLINKWDGTTLTLDKENGAILATMIAAGTKNVTTGAFTGVMMGNWAKKGDETFDSEDKRENASGLYGFLEGASTFGLLDDGTGYIGPAGRGRIQFDGNNALISNSDKSCYMNLNPNTLTTSKAGYYNADNTGISPYFLYAKTPNDPNKFLGFDGSRDMTWANAFMQDDSNNYFVVDPERGVLTTGGIVSRYGRIGNWYINNTGLYQKYVDDDPNDGNAHDQYLKAKTALEAAKLVLSYSTEENPWDLKDYLTDEEIAFVESNLHKTIGVDIITEEDLDAALNSVKSELADVDFTRDRFMYLGFPGVDRTKIFDTWKEYSELIQEAEDERDEALGKKINIDTGGDVASIIKNLYQYLDKTAFSLDIYHYFNTYIAVQANLDYIVSILKQYNILDEKGKSLITSTQKERLKSKLIGYKATFDDSGNLNREAYEQYWNDFSNYAWQQFDAGELTEEEYYKKMEMSSDAITTLNSYVSITSGIETLSNSVRDALYDKHRLSHDLLTYKLLNQYNHNHYNGGRASHAQYGLFSNVVNVLGVSLNNNMYGYSAIVYADGYNGTHLTITEEGQYYMFSDVWQQEGEIFYTLNDIGAQRVASYDPRKFDESTEWWNSNITFSGSTSNRSLQFWIVEESAGMPPSEYSAPTMYTTDSGGSIFNQVWRNARASTSSYTINGQKLNSNHVDLEYLTEILVPDLQAYCYYYDIYYNQALFYMLTQGLAKTAISSPSDYETAMAIINQVGGLEQIRRHGLATHHIVQADFQFDGLDEDAVERIKKAYEEGINKRYNEIIAQIKVMRSKAIATLYAKGDTNKYAIYAGYNSPYDWADDESQEYLDPLFGVKWNGYMIARHGKIGDKSPWYIGDGGLTQKNNSGIIFLGDPEEDGRAYTQDDLASFNTGNATKFMLDEIDPITGNQKPILCDAHGNPLNFLLPNSDRVKLPDSSIEYVIRQKAITTSSSGGTIIEDISPELIMDYQTGEPQYGIAIYDSLNDILTYQDEHWQEYQILDFLSYNPVPPKNSISAEAIKTAISSSALGPEAYESFGKFAIYAGDHDGIHFGIRMDGTIYGDRAQFNQIRINNSNVSGTYIEDSNFFDVSIQNSLFDANGDPIVDEDGNPYHSYVLMTDELGNSHTTFTDYDGNQSVYYGGTTTYTDEAGNQQTISNTGQTFIDPVGHTYELNGQGYSYTRQDGSYTYVDEDGMHFHPGYTRVTPNADQVNNPQDPAALGWYERRIKTDANGQQMYYKKYDVDLDAYVDDFERPQYEYVLTTDHQVNFNKEYYYYPDENPLEFQFPNNTKFFQGDDAAIADRIIREKMILMGGTISAWGTNREGCMATYRVYNGDVLEAIALDASKNEIRLADSQIVLNGTLGVLFIGSKIATSGSSGSSTYTKGTIYLARVALVGLTTGATTYNTSMSPSSCSSTLTTYTGIQYNQNVQQSGDQQDGMSTAAGGWLDDPSAEYVESPDGGAAYLVQIHNDLSADNKRISLTNQSICQVLLNNRFDIGLYVDDQHPYVDPDTGIPDFDSAMHDGSRGYGFRLEFIHGLNDASNDNPNSAISPARLKTMSYEGSAFTDDDLEDIGYVDGSCIIRPFKSNSILGTPARRWNVFANWVQIGNSYAATVAEVYENDARLQNNIIRVNEATAAAFRKAVQALNAAWSIIARFKRYMNGELTAADATALGLSVNPDGTVDTSHLGVYVSNALAAALSDQGAQQTLSTTISSLLTSDTNNELSQAVSTLLTADADGALSQAVSSMLSADAEGVLSSAISGMLMQDADGVLSSALSSMLSQDAGGVLSQALSGMLSQDAGGALSSALSSVIASDSSGAISSAINGLLGEGSTLNSQIAAIAQQVFNKMWEGLTAQVSGSGTSGTVTISSASGSKTVHISLNVQQTVSACSCTYSVNENGTVSHSHTQGTPSYTISWSGG